MSSSAPDVEREFDRAMLQVYKDARDQAGYNAVRFLSMLADGGGLETARTLLHASTVSDGYTALWERQRLDLTVEAVILDQRWRPLFTDAERAIARKRLRDYGFTGDVYEEHNGES